MTAPTLPDQHSDSIWWFNPFVKEKSVKGIGGLDSEWCNMGLRVLGNRNWASAERHNLTGTLNSPVLRDIRRLA